MATKSKGGSDGGSGGDLRAGRKILDIVNTKYDIDSYRDLSWSGTFADYLDLVVADPQIARNAFQRLYDMIVSYGSEEKKRFRGSVTHYSFFDDPIDRGGDRLFGLDEALDRFVGILKAAALGYGAEKRVILLHGPVGSAKSTIVRLLKKGLELYSLKPEGAIYTFGWKNDSGGYDDCPIHEEPLNLIPLESQAKVLEEINANVKDGGHKIALDGFLCPSCRFNYMRFMDACDGDWTKVIENVRVRRFRISEKDRVGIGTFQPKDEKNQDSTELTGDINYRKIAEYGSDSDPRAFNFDGEFNIANRGLIEFVEILKLDVAFLYDLLGATQEHRVKPKKFAQTPIDEVIVGHTNEPEYKRLQSNELMEAFRDRTIKVDVPYNLALGDEKEIYRKLFTPERMRGKHIAPHTIETAAMWAVMTRLEEPKNQALSLMQKLKLYNGKSITGFTDDSVKELRFEAVREGMEGISPRYIQDKVSNAIVQEESAECVNPFMVMNELSDGLDHHSLVTSDEVKKRYRELLNLVKDEYEDIVKNEVQRAVTADENAIENLASNYIDNLKAYTQKEKIVNKFTGQEEPPDERLMRSIEEKIDIPEARKDDFRREIMNYIGALALEKKPFTWKTNERLKKALEKKLFEDRRDTIKLTSLVADVVDREGQEKIEVVKTRLIKEYGYCEHCATDVLNYVASIFARGDAKGSGED